MYINIISFISRSYSVFMRIWLRFHVAVLLPSQFLFCRFFCSFNEETEIDAMKTRMTKRKKSHSFIISESTIQATRTHMNVCICLVQTNTMCDDKIKCRFLL